MNVDDFPNLKAFDVNINEQHVVEICLNRPDAINTMNNDFWDELPAIITALDRQAVARVIILSSKGKHFTAGMDLSVFDSLSGDPNHEPARAAEKSRRWILDMQEAFTILEKARMPVIAAIQAPVLAAAWI